MDSDAPDSMEELRKVPETEPALAAAFPLRWWTLATLSFVQFMIAIDLTIVNVALPTIRRELGFTAEGLTWVVSAYMLAAGGLMLLGGRLGDLTGRRRMFMIGTALFGMASLAAGLAVSPEMLVVSRFVQGIGEALAVPAGLAIVALIFPDEGERAKALGIWGALSGLGAVVGVVLSGFLTGLVDWRWVFFINLPLAAVPLLVIRRLVPENRAPDRDRIDWQGAGLLTAGLIALVNGLLTVGSGVLRWQTAGSIAAGVVLLVSFVVYQARSARPLVPLRFFVHRVRALGSILTILLIGVSEAVFFLIVLYNQDVLDFSPLKSGLAWLPFCLAFLPGVLAAGQLLPKLGMRTLLTASTLVMTSGVMMFSLIDDNSSYWTHVMPAMVVTGFGFAMSLPTVQNAALCDVSEQNAGLGSGVITTVQQVGGALGLATFVAIALGGASHATEATGGLAVDGVRLTFRVAAATLVVGAALNFWLMPRRIRDQ